MLPSQKPWRAEVELAEADVIAMIDDQFDALRPCRIEPFGEGWDNTAYLVNDRYIFRFPRRQIAVECIEVEMRVLPVVAEHLPLRIPEPIFIGCPQRDYPWPFVGYESLPGRTACCCNLDDEARAAMVEPIADFLRVLHSLPVDIIERASPPPDTIRRLDVPYQAQRMAHRVEQALAQGLIEDASAVHTIIEMCPPDWQPRTDTLVHGDLYIRHLLVDDNNVLTGVIDWGDVHMGDPACDLSVLFSFLPPAARKQCLSSYGEVDAASLAVARFKALQTAIALLLYADDIEDSRLLGEARRAFTLVISD